MKSPSSYWGYPHLWFQPQRSLVFGILLDGWPSWPSATSAALEGHWLIPMGSSWDFDGFWWILMGSKWGFNGWYECEWVIPKSPSVALDYDPQLTGWRMTRVDSGCLGGLAPAELRRAISWTSRHLPRVDPPANLVSISLECGIGVQSHALGCDIQRFLKDETIRPFRPWRLPSQFDHDALHDLTGVVRGCRGGGCLNWPWK